MDLQTGNRMVEGRRTSSLFAVATQNDLANASCDQGTEISIVETIGRMHQQKKESETIANTSVRKHLGIYYTDYRIARRIASDTLAFFDNSKLVSLKFLEPCAGTGIFAIAYIDEIIQRLGLHDAKIIQQIVNNIYCADIDSQAISILREILPSYIQDSYHVTVQLNDANFFVGNVLFDDTDGEFKKRDLLSIFGVHSGFDVVLSNPPYRLLKANSNSYSDSNGSNPHGIYIENLISFIKENDVYKYNQGTLNYYKIFLEEILENYTNAASAIGVIVPVGLLNDAQSEKLRKLIINNCKISNISIIPERNEFFPDISQAFCFLSFSKASVGEDFRINSCIAIAADLSKSGTKVAISSLRKISESLPIVDEGQEGWSILQKLSEHPKLKELPGLKNARGELDLTFCKSYMTSHSTSFPLIRGKDIASFKFKSYDDFVLDSFLDSCGQKRKYIKKERIVCQQISNIHLKKRLKFCKVPENFVLANSCNFISLNDSLFAESNLSLDYLLAILNSSLIDWRFKLTNSNNHISNYELAELPIAIPSPTEKAAIETRVRALMESYSQEREQELDSLVLALYRISPEEAGYLQSK